MIGQTVSHYHILQKLGEGGMGKVYLAEDTKLNRTVALKFLPSELIRDEQTRLRFVHEAQATSALDHPNIGVIYEINESDENPFIAMAYYAGGTLRDKIAQNDLTIIQAVNIASCIARGLQKSHSKDIVHRDVKPANILFSEDGEPKIIDFGLAKFMGRTVLTRTGTTLGTIAYMSPEQTQGTKIDRRTDIWALGVILYEMLAGERPFKGDYEQAVMYSIINEEPEFISKIRSDIPSALEKIVSKALNKNPEKRFQSTDEMCEALENALNDITSGKSVTVSTFRLGRKQRRILIRVTPVLLLILAIFGYFLFYKDAQATPVSIVLLPLENITRDAEHDWFTEGMTDALITNLARISGLRIISRSSVMKYKDTNKSSSEIAADLGVSYLIEGSVVKSNDMVKITTRLIDAATDEYVWAQEYERNFTDILSLQSDVARKIAEQIKVNLTPEEKNLFSGQQSVNPAAYEAYLKGNFYLFKLTRQALEIALHYYEQSAELDPDYALAYAGIALVWGGRAQMGYIPMHIAIKKFKPAAAKALELDNTLAEVHYMNAVLYAWGEWKWDLAVKSFENAIRLNPNLAEAHAYYSHALFILNQPEEAIHHIDRALELDPFNSLFQALYAMDLNYIHQYDKAINLLQTTLKTSPADPIALSTLRTTYHQKKMYNKALDIWRRSFEVRGDQQSIDALNRGNEEGGYSKALQRVAESKIEQSKTKYISPWPIATLYTRAGMPEEALQWFEKALIARDPNIPYLNVDPIFDYLRDDPRFKNLIREIGLPVSEKK